MSYTQKMYLYVTQWHIRMSIKSNGIPEVFSKKRLGYKVAKEKKD